MLWRGTHKRNFVVNKRVNMWRLIWKTCEICWKIEITRTNSINVKSGLRGKFSSGNELTISFENDLEMLKRLEQFWKYFVAFIQSSSVYEWCPSPIWAMTTFTDEALKCLTKKTNSPNFLLNRTNWRFKSSDFCEFMLEAFTYQYY